MAEIHISNVPDVVVEGYKARARLAGTSLEQALRDVIMANAPFTAAERTASSERILGQFQHPVPSLTKDEIRDGLE